MSATIDGVAWSASDVRPTLRVPPLVELLGITGGGTQAETLFDLSFTRSGLGTQSLDPHATLDQPAASISIVTPQIVVWGTRAIGGSGTVTLTLLTTNRAVGTFSFVAQELGSSIAPLQRQVTNGKFDVTF